MARSVSSIGVSRTMAEDDDGLKVEGVLAMGTRRGAEAYELLSMGALKGFSIGYMPIKWEHDSARGVRRLKEIRLFEWSAVTFHANELAVVTGMKAAEVLGMASRLVEGKAGRRLSASSRSNIESAIEALSALLADDEPEKSTRPGGDEAASKSKREPSDADTLRDWIARNFE